MTVENVLQLIESLSNATRVAIRDKHESVDLLSALIYVDDAARADLEKAIWQAKEAIG